MSNQDLFRKVKALGLPAGKYALFGSAPLGIRNLKECHDIDIIVTGDLWDELKKKYEARVTPQGHEYLAQEEIEIWQDWSPGSWDVGQLISEAEEIDGLPFVKLEQVLAWKKQYGREKDLKDVEMIEKNMQP